MNMKKYLLLIVLFPPIFSIGQELISTQGESFSNANASIDFSIGEVIIATGTSGTVNLTQGFHQTKWSVASVENFALNYQVVVFPNPLSEQLNIRTPEFDGVTYQLTNSTGQLLRSGTLTTEETSISVENLAAGQYSLTFIKQSNKLKSLNLVKL